jgi:hypothetical protein
MTKVRLSPSLQFRTRCKISLVGRARPRMRCWLAGIALQAFFSAPLASPAAPVITRLHTAPNSGVTIEIVTPYEKMPSAGLMPARIRISNQSGTSRTWLIKTESQESYHRRQMRHWSRAFTVEHQAEAEFEVLLPMATMPTDRHHQSPSLLLRATGHGSIDGYGTTIGGGHHGAPALTNLYRGVSEKTVDAIRHFSGSVPPNTPTLDFRIAASGFSANHLAYHSMDQLWITTGEWRSLPRSKAQAIAQWVRLGGDLVIVVDAGSSRGELAAIPAHLQAQQDLSHYGFGRIRFIPHPDETPWQQRLASTEEGMIPRHQQLSNYDPASWKMRVDIGNIAYPVGMVLAFSVAFALLLGPVNLLIALCRNRPAQMLWTTPVFSLAASILIAIVILLQDGTGGRGLRMTLGFLDPYSRSLSTIQEQVSLTGVLLSGAFKPDPDTTITPLRTGQTQDQRKRIYYETDGHYSGDWFGSRSIQAQLIERAQPTRQRIERTDPTTPDAPPVLHSSVSTPLYDVYYRDAQGQYWHTPVLHTGERKTLDTSSHADFYAWWGEHRKHAGPRMHMAFDRLANVNNMFYADTRTAGDFIVETLPSISWQNRGLILTGIVEIQGAL